MTDETVTDELVPVGATITALYWWNTPDKYEGPAAYDTRAKAEAAADRTGGRMNLEIQAGVTRFFAGLRTDEAPAPGAVVVAAERYPPPKYGFGRDTSTQARVEASYGEITFQNPDGTRATVRPYTTHPMQG
ncbi:hypothetical protein GCM10029964_033890 [Kibdelosporangium lantanae]